MGLDITHYHVEDAGSTDGSEHLIEEDGPLTKFLAQAVAKTNRYIDWAASFAARGLSCEHFMMASQVWDSTGTCAKFMRTPEAPVDVPERVQFRWGRTEDDFGDLVLVDRLDQVLQASEIGYQRKGVESEFFREFESWEVITDLARVERILELCLADRRKTFRRDFLDNWDDERSFVIVWY